MSQKIADRISKALTDLYAQTLPASVAELTLAKVELVSITTETSGKQIKVVISGKCAAMEYKELVKVLYRTLGVLFPFPQGEYQGLDGKSYRRTHVAYDEVQRLWQVKFNLFMAGATPNQG